MRPVLVTVLVALGSGLVSQVQAEQPAFPSPDGRFLVVAVKNAAPQSYRVNLLDAKTRKVLDSYDPQTRAMEVFWNPASTMVAINEDVSHASGHLSVWRIVKERFKAVILPARLRDENIPDGEGWRTREAISHFIADKDAKRIKFFWGSHAPTATGWRNETDLDLTLEGEAQLEGAYQLRIDYEFTVRCGFPSPSILQETKKQYAIVEEK